MTAKGCRKGSRRGGPGGIALLAALLLPSPARGQEARVDSAKALAEALRAAQPGQVVVLADGTYRDLRIEFAGAGTPDRPITLRAETPGRVLLTGTSTLRLSGEHLVVEGLQFREGSVGDHVIAFRGADGRAARRCRLTRSAVVEYDPPEPDRRSNVKWVSLYGTGNRVDHCAFAGKRTGGATLVVWIGEEPAGHRIDRNWFGPRPPLGRNGGETIRIGTSEVSLREGRVLVEENLFEECDGEMEAVSNKSCANVFRGNTFLRCAGTLTLRHGDRCAVEGNFFLGGGRKETGGVRVMGEGHRVVNNYFSGTTGRAGAVVAVGAGVPESPLNGYVRSKGLFLGFNTFAGNRGPCIDLASGLGSDRRTLRPEDCSVVNNVLVGDGERIVAGEALRTRWAGNLAWAGEVPEGLRRADPLLREDAGGLLRPAAESPAIDAAEGDHADVTQDIDGQPRAGRKDAGCDERSDAPAGRKPLGRGDVGPDWLKR